MFPLAPSQKAVRDHHNDCVPMEAYPLPSLILSPSQLVFGIFVESIYVPTSMHILHHLLQLGIHRKVREVVFPISLPLSIAWSFADEPAQCLTLTIQSAICTHRHKLLSQPSLGSFTPADGWPLPPGNLMQRRISSLDTLFWIIVQDNSEVAWHGIHIVFFALLQTRSDEEMDRSLLVLYHQEMGKIHARMCRVYS